MFAPPPEYAVLPKKKTPSGGTFEFGYINSKFPGLPNRYCAYPVDLLRFLDEHIDISLSFISHPKISFSFGSHRYSDS